MDLDLDDARDALEAALPRALGGRRALARHADLWAERLGRPLDPVAATLPFAALSLNARALVGQLVEGAWHSAPWCATLRAHVEAADPPPATVFLAFAAATDWLPAGLVVTDVTRREELLRRWAGFNGVGLAVRGQAEDPARSARVLERLDFRAVAAEEARLARERRVAAAIEDVNRTIRSGKPL